MHILRKFSPSGSPTILVFRTKLQYFVGDPPNGGAECKGCMKQELRYRKQIARQLRTQYVGAFIGLNITLRP